MKSSAARLVAKSPSAFKANEVHSESRPKNQANPGTLGHARGPVTGNEPGAKIRIVDHSLHRTDAGPVVGLLQAGIRQVEAYRLAEIFLIVVRGIAPQVRVRSKQVFVYLLSVGRSRHGSSNHQNLRVFPFLSGTQAHRVFIGRGIVCLIGRMRLLGSRRPHKCRVLT